MRNNHLCRCCLSETCFKDISNEYFNAGQKEVYADILLDTFNINISYQEDNSRLICEDCIVRLRDAAAFKKQVENAEECFNKKVFKKVCDGADLLNLIKCKDEFLDHITGDFDDDEIDDDDEAGDVQGDDIRGGDCDGFGWQDEKMQDDGVITIKLETPDDDDDDLPLLLRMKKLKKKYRVARSKKPLKEEKPKKPKKERKALPYLERKKNTLILINNSNICLFESLKTKYRCFYCKNSYFNITELREHSLTHDNQNYLKQCINRLRGMSFKLVDISGLSCKICSETLKDLSQLKDHLSNLHDIEFSGDEHMLIPYRLDKDFECVLCAQSFNTFYRLSVHMNSHYMNHVCEICGASFINRTSLRVHVSARHREKKCSVCALTFPTTYLRVKHMRKVHNSSLSKRYCLICNKTFRYTYMLNEHKIQEHGMKRQIATCDECGRTFPSAVNLRTHVRCVHMKERNHACVRCGMCFFTSHDKRRHEATHHDVRLFSCNYCEGRFKSKDSMRRHLKRQHGNFLADTGPPT